MPATTARKRNNARRRGTAGFVAHAEPQTPHHADFPLCSECGRNATWPTGLCRICEKQNEVVLGLAEYEGREAAVAFIHRPQPVNRKQGRTA